MPLLVTQAPFRLNVVKFFRKSRPDREGIFCCVLLLLLHCLRFVFASLPSTISTCTHIQAASRRANALQVSAARSACVSDFLVICGRSLAIFPSCQHAELARRCQTFFAQEFSRTFIFIFKGSKA